MCHFTVFKSVAGEGTVGMSVLAEINALHYA